MSEAISVTCPHCRRALSVPAQNLGQRCKCSLCGQVFTVQTGETPQPPPTPSGALGDLVSSSRPTGGPAAQTITPLMGQYLLATRPWVLFLSILGFIATGLMVVAAIAMMVIGASAGPYGRSGPGPIFGLIYLLVAVLYAVPAWLLSNYASAIKRFRHSRSSRDMEAALGSQKSFWRFVGIVTAVILSIYLFILLILVFVAAGAG